MKPKYLILPFLILVLSCQKHDSNVDDDRTVEIAVWPKITIEGKGEKFPQQLIINETYFEDIYCEMVVDIVTDKFSIWFGKSLSTMNFANDSISFYQYDFENLIPNSDLIFNSSVANSIKQSRTNRYTFGWHHTMGKLLFYIKNGEQIFEKQFTKQNDQLMEMLWGAPYFVVSTGVVKVIDSKIKINCIERLKFAIYGDSFIEGSTMQNNLDKRLAYRFAESRREA